MVTNMKMRLKDGVLVRDELNGRDVSLNIKSVRPRGVVSAYVQGTDIPLFEKRENKVIVDGSMFTAMKYFDILPPVNLPTYNTALNLENIVPLTASEQMDT